MSSVHEYLTKLVSNQMIMEPSDHQAYQLMAHCDIGDHPTSRT